MQALKPIRVKVEVEEQIRSDETNQPLSPMASMFSNPESDTYIIVKIGFKTQINLDTFKANIANTLLAQPRFSSVLVMDERSKDGNLRWVSTEVDLDNHVVVPKLNHNDIESPDKYVEDYIYNLSKTAIDGSIPRWDFHILNLKTSDAESVGVIRIHHSIGDGTSLISLLLACSRKVSDPEKLPSLPFKPKVDSKGEARQQRFMYWLGVISLIWNTIVGVVSFLATVLTLLKDTPTPLKSSKIIVPSTPRRIVHKILSLDDVKLVKTATNTTVNDVILGVTQAGLSQYLNRRYDESKNDNEESKGKKNNLPSNIRLRAIHFMNNRAAPGIQELADMMKKESRARWGNQIGYVILPFTIALRKDPLDYVWDAKARMDSKKASLEASFSFYLAKYLLKFLGPKMATFPSHTTLWYSNVVGPQDEISYYGHPVSYIAPTCYGQPTGLLIHIVSYANKINIILSVDENIIPDPHRLCDDFEESLKLIKSAAIARGAVKT